MFLYMSSQKFGQDTKFLKDWINQHDNKIFIIPNALDAKDEGKIQENLKDDIKLLEEIGFCVSIIDLKLYFGKYNKLREELSKYNACCVMGGNVFVLRKAVELSGFDIFLKDKKSSDNYLYIGYSAGSCVLSDNLEYLKTIDKPITLYNQTKMNYEGIGFVDYLFIPHYKSNYHKVHLIEDLVNKCKNEHIKYKAIKDGEVIIEQIK